jgi:RHS repeat-associated protein
LDRLHQQGRRVNDADSAILEIDSSLSACVQPDTLPAGSYYAADVITAQDYYPFGMIEPSRQYVKDSLAYRYKFNGKELDADMDGNNYDYGFRIYNPQLGKFLSVDPLTGKYPMLTPYQFSSNRPIDGIDLDGLEYSPAGWSSTPSMTNMPQIRNTTAVQVYSDANSVLAGHQAAPKSSSTLTPTPSTSSDGDNSKNTNSSWGQIFYSADAGNDGRTGHSDEKGENIDALTAAIDGASGLGTAPKAEVPSLPEATKTALELKKELTTPSPTDTKQSTNNSSTTSTTSSVNNKQTTDNTEIHATGGINPAKGKNVIAYDKGANEHNYTTQGTKAANNKNDPDTTVRSK